MANYYDYSLIRNRLTFDLGRQMNLAYTPKSVCVDVVISGEYYGSYQLCQQVRVGKNNVNIYDLEEHQETEEPGITGGYLLSMGEAWLTEDDVENLEGAGGRFRLEKPEYDDSYPADAKEAQLAYINNYLDELDTLINNLDDDNPDNDTIDGKTWRDYMDEDSYIDYFFMQEFSQNGDAFGSNSTYLYKDKGGKLFWGPLWDFDFVAWAAYATDYLSSRGVDSFEMIGSCPWMDTLLENDPEFKQKVIDRWAELSEIIGAAAEDGGLIDQYKEQTYYSALANYMARPTYLAEGEDYWGGVIELVDENGDPYVLNYTNEINRLKNYIMARKAWLDENIESIGEGGGYGEDDYPPVKFYVDGEVYAVVHPDMEEWELKQDEIPANPTKEGFKFKGWYMRDEEGNEVKFTRHMWPYKYDYELEESVPCDIYAKFVKASDAVDLESLSFARKKVYVGLDSYYYDSEDSEDYPYVMGEYVDLSSFLNYKPMDADLSDIEWFVDEDFSEYDDEPVTVDEDGTFCVSDYGEFTVGCRAGKLEAKIKIVAVDMEDLVTSGNIHVEENLSMKAGQYGDLDFYFYRERNLDYHEYANVQFVSLDTNVVKVNDNGMVFAVGKGETQVVTVYNDDGELKIKATKVTVGDDAKEETKPDVKPQSNDNKVGNVITDGTYNYKITKAGAKDGKTVGEVSVIGLRNKNIKSINIADSITFNSVKYNVTSIGAKAFAKNKKVKKATIGSNVTTIGARAFFGTKKLSKLTVKARNLKKIGKKAFYRKKGKKLKIKVKKAKKKAYKKLFKKAKTNKFKI